LTVITHKHAFSSNNDSEDDEVVNINSTILEPKLTGEVLGKTVVSILKELNLDCLNCVGIATDGCSIMTSTLRGAVQFVQSYAPHAVYSPCSNHSLNLSISKSSSVQAIRNSVGLIKEAISFFNMSSKRNYVLLTVLKGNPRLKSLCETRWIERHDSIIIFQSSLTYILEALTSVSSWHEQDSSSKAKTLLTALCACEFIISLFTLASLLSVTVAVSNILQNVNSDISNSTEIIHNVIDNLENKRTNCSEEFNLIFEVCKKEMIKHDTEIKKPRIVCRQTARSNYQRSTIEDYYRVSIYIPLLDNVLDDLKNRFLNEKNQAVLKLTKLMPRNIIEEDSDDENELVKLFIKYFSFQDCNMSELELKSELSLWKSKWKREKN